jgi:flagellar basal-body rod modification protein FlgD
MDISSIRGVPMVEAPDPYGKANSSEVDRDAFIKMFLAQLEHQDPLNPMDGSEFASQLAQFSSLEQLFNANENLEALTAAQDNQARYESLNLIGKEILAEGSGMVLTGGKPAQGAFDLKESAECTAVITDERGVPVRTLFLGTLRAGSHEFAWDGENSAGEEMPEGKYTFEITALNGIGESVPVARKVLGTVDRVRVEGDASTLYVGDIPVELGSVVDVRLPGGSDGESDASTTDTGGQPDGP